MHINFRDVKRKEKKMNKNNYEWVTIGNARFYTDGTTCTDIEVMNESKNISFIYPKFKVDRKKCQKVFSSVEKEGTFSQLSFRIRCFQM